MDEREMFDAWLKSQDGGASAFECWQAGRRTTPDREAWISVEDRLPEEGQAIAFVVHWPGNEFLHGRVLGGTFHSYGGKMPTFSVPGTGFKATHWMPLPTAPTSDKGGA
ncbi:DUF551 domain-containing protein [Burkholderia cenocepacia]